jgi:hypothetical protein
MARRGMHDPDKALTEITTIRSRIAGSMDSRLRPGAAIADLGRRGRRIGGPGAVLAAADLAGASR